MPLDPSIPLAVKSPDQAPPSLTANIGALMQLRGMDSQIALRNAEVEQTRANAENINAQAQARNLDLRDQNFLQNASLDPAIHSRLALGDTSDVDAHIQPKTAQALQASSLKLLQDRSTLTKDDLANRNTAAKQVGDSIFGLRALKNADGTPDFARINESLPDALATLGPAIKTLGLDPNKFAGHQITNLAQLDGLAASMQAETQVNDKVLAQKKDEAVTGKDEAEAQIKKTQAAHMSPEGLLPEQEVTAAATRSRDAATAAERAIDNKRADAQLAVSRGHLAIANQEHAEKTASGAPLNDRQQSLVHQIANGDMDPRIALSRLPYGEKEAILQGVALENPAWAQAFATKRAFTDPQGKQAQNLGTIARIVEHTDRYTTNSDALGIAPVLGFSSQNTPGTPMAAVRNDAHAISAELEKLLSGGVGTVGQVKAWQSALTSSLPSTRKTAIDEISQLIGGQYTGMNQGYKAGTGQDLPQDQFVSPHGRQWLQKNGINVTGAAKPAAGASGAPSATHTLNGHPIAIDPKTNTWIFTETGHPAK